MNVSFVKGEISNSHDVSKRKRIRSKLYKQKKYNKCRMYRALECSNFDLRFTRTNFQVLSNRSRPCVGIYVQIYTVKRCTKYETQRKSMYVLKCIFIVLGADVNVVIYGSYIIRISRISREG